MWIYSLLFLTSFRSFDPRWSCVFSNGVYSRFVVGVVCFFASRHHTLLTKLNFFLHLFFENTHSLSHTRKKLFEIENLKTEVRKRWLNYTNHRECFWSRFSFRLPLFEFYSCFFSCLDIYNSIIRFFP